MKSNSYKTISYINFLNKKQHKCVFQLWTRFLNIELLIFNKLTSIPKVYYSYVQVGFWCFFARLKCRGTYWKRVSILSFVLFNVLSVY